MRISARRSSPACSSRPIPVGSSQARRELRGARACRGQAERCVFLSHSCSAQGHQRLHALRAGRRALPRSTRLSRCPLRRRARATQGSTAQGSADGGGAADNEDISIRPVFTDSGCNPGDGTKVTQAYAVVRVEHDRSGARIMRQLEARRFHRWLNLC